MKKITLSLVLIISLLTLVGCVDTKTTSTSKSLTAEDISSKLMDSDLPMSNIITYDEKTDPNKLLGRPHQYISKVNFADESVIQLDESDPRGGSIETFSNPTDLNNRKDYIESIGKKSPLFAEYVVVNGNYLLRLNKALTPSQVDKYKEEFMKIK